MDKPSTEINAPLRLLICVSGIYFFYLYYGILQEQLYHPDEKDGSLFTSTFFLLFLQCLVNTLLALFMRTVVGISNQHKKLSE